MELYIQLKRALSILSALAIMSTVAISYALKADERERRAQLAPNEFDGRVVMYYSPHCGGCREMLPVVKNLRDRGFPISSINLLEHPSVGEEMRIRYLPTFVHLVYEKETRRHEGMFGDKYLESFCRGN